MLSIVPIAVLSIITTYFFVIGVRLAWDKSLGPFHDASPIGMIMVGLSNKIIGSIYISGSLITLAILWS